MKIKLYRNLHKNCFSVVSRETNRVILHTDSILISDVIPRVSEKGRQRVLEERVKNVHARLFANIATTSPTKLTLDMPFREITYNPYLYSTFVYKDDLSEFTGCKTMLCEDNRLYEIIGDVL